MNKSTQLSEIDIPDISKPIIDKPLFVSIVPKPPPTSYYYQPPPKIIIIEYPPPVQTYLKKKKIDNLPISVVGE